VKSICGGEDNIKRIIIYTRNFIRITFEKRLVSFLTLWNHLEEWSLDHLIKSYAFRNMDMEEVLSTMIDPSH
jgi:hypothetical protein